MTKPSRPISIIVTQILMLISLVPIVAGAGFAFVWGLISTPGNMLTIRALLFFTVALVLPIIFLVFGFGGLWKRKTYGQWLALIFLAFGNLVGAYRFALRLNELIYRGPAEESSSDVVNSDAILIVSLAIQSLMLVLLIVLFLKLLSGKREKLFFESP